MPLGQRIAIMALRRSRSSPFGDLLRAQIGYVELAKELLLPAGSLRSFLVHGLETTLVLPLENLHLGRTLGFEGSKPPRLADGRVVGLGGAPVTGTTATLAPAGLMTVDGKAILGSHDAASRALAGIDHHPAPRWSDRQQTDGGRNPDCPLSGFLDEIQEPTRSGFAVLDSLSVHTGVCVIAPVQNVDATTAVKQIISG
jgi:hypothetical protein